MSKLPQFPRRTVYHAIDTAGRAAPHDAAAESELITAGFGSAAIIDAVLDLVSPREMYGDANGRVWGAMVSLRVDGKPVSAATVCARLRERDELEAVGGIAAVMAMEARGFGEPDAELAHAHATTIREMAHRRKIAEALQVQLGEAYSGRTAHKQFVEGVESAVFASTRGLHTADEGVDLARLIAEEEFRIGEIAAGRVSSGGLPTGLAALDERLGGLAEGEITIVAGRPAMGKTSLLRDIAQHVAASNHDGIARGVLIFSLEMTRKKFLHRMVSAHASVNLKRVIGGRLEGAEAERAARAREHLATLPIVIDDAPGLTPARLRSRLRRAMMRFDGDRQKISLVVIDQLMWMRAERVYGTASSDRSRELGDTLLGVAEIAKETGVHTIVAHQLNRDVKGRTGKALRPRMTDIAESGQIEMHSQNIVAPHRPAYYESDPERLTDEQRRLCECVIIKQRDGAQGIARLDWDGEFARFRSEGAWQR